IPLLLASIAIAQTGGTGALSGTVVDDSGKPVAAAVLASMPGTKGSAPVNVRAQAAADGTFSMTGLQAGTYTVCVQVKGGGYLDPCTWSPVAPTVQIDAGQTV